MFTAARYAPPRTERAVNVLYVEDDPLNRRVVRDMLRVAGAEMAEAADAETGLRMIDENDYSVVLMDLRMPGMDGLAAIERIRARSDAKRHLPVVVITADTAADMRQRCLTSGADEVLAKPVAMNLLFDAIGKTTVRRALAAAR